MAKLIYTLVVLAGCLNVQAQSVLTFFSDPSKKIDDAMVLDYQGNLYGSHFMGTNVYKITPSGQGSVFATGFNTPNGLAFDSQNNLYVCDLSGNRIYKLSHSGVFLDTFNISTPSGIIKSLGSDTMLFTQYTGNKLSKLAPDGSTLVIASGTPMVGSVGLAYSNSGQLYIANFTNRKIYSVSSNTLTYVATVPGPSNGALGFIAYANGFLYGTGYNDHKIYKIHPNFIDSVVVLAGTTLGNSDGSVATAQFNRPNGIIPSSTGDSLYISDFGSGRVRVISFSLITASIEQENTPATVQIYPSPSSDVISLTDNTDVESLQIYDSQGKHVISSTEKTINVNNLSPGVYSVIIKTQTKKLHTKFIKY